MLFLTKCPSAATAELWMPGCAKTGVGMMIQTTAVVK